MGYFLLTGCVFGVYDNHMIRTQIHLTENQHKKIKNTVRKTGISKAEFIRRIIDSYFEHQETKREINTHITGESHDQS